MIYAIAYRVGKSGFRVFPLENVLAAIAHVVDQQAKEFDPFLCHLCALNV